MTNPAPRRAEYVGFSQRLLVPDPCKLSGTVSGPNMVQVLPANTAVRSSVKDWRKRIAMKLDATGPYTRIITEVKTQDPCYLMQTGTTSCTATNNKLVNTTRYLYSSLGLASFPGMPDAPDLDSTCASKLHAFAQESDASVNALIPLVELREFHGLVRGMTRAATNFVGAKHLLLDKVSSRLSLNRILAEAGNGWLAFSFGLKPMMSDAESIAMALAAAAEKPQTQVISAKAEKTWQTRSESSSSMDFAGAGYYTQRFEHKLSQRYLCGLTSIANSAEGWSAYSSRLGLNIGSVIPALWELMPYSWLIDYFTNVGSYLDDTFLAERSPYFVCKTKRYEVLQTVCLNRVTSTTAKILHPGNYVARHVRFVRTKEGTALPRQTLRIRSFDEIALNANNKLLNLISLLWTRNKNIVKKYGYENTRTSVRVPKSRKKVL